MKAPITTLITNNRSIPTRIGTTFKSLTVPENSTIEVDGDFWSQCKGAQRRALVELIASGMVDFTLRIVYDNGHETLVPYTLTMFSNNAPAQPTQSVQESPTKAQDTKVQDDSHIIKTSDEEMATLATSMGLKKEAIGVDPDYEAIRDVVEKDSKIVTQAKLDAKEKEAESIVTVTKPEAPAKKEQEEQEPATEQDEEVPQEEPETKEPLPDPTEEDKAKFNELCANRKWKDALELLKALLGEDKVTISSRTIQSCPSWEQVMAKIGA